MDKKIVLLFSMVFFAGANLLGMENEGTLGSASGTTNSDVKTLNALIAEAKKECSVPSVDVTFLAALAHDGAGFLAYELKKLSLADAVYAKESE